VAGREFLDQLSDLASQEGPCSLELVKLLVYDDIQQNCFKYFQMTK
jgi:hypothetical protein